MNSKPISHIIETNKAVPYAGIYCDLFRHNIKHNLLDLNKLFVVFY